MNKAQRLRISFYYRKKALCDIIKQTICERTKIMGRIISIINQKGGVEMCIRDRLKAYEEGPEIGRSETTIPAELDGDDVKITFNCIYIEDIIKHSKGDKIYLHIKKSGPMLVEQEEDKTYRYVVTPMSCLLYTSRCV